MKKLLLISVALVAWIASYAQYFGQTVFKEGFDNETDLAEWKQENKTAGDLTLWKIAENDIYSFTDIDETSTASAVLALNSKETILTLTSPEIDLAGKENLQIGFYGNDFSHCFSGGVDFRFRVTKDGGQTWEDLFKEGDSYNTEKIKGWNLYKYALPSKFDRSKIRLQFYVDASTMNSNPRGLEGYMDGVFISERPAIEPEITSVNYSTNDRNPSTGAYGNEEPVIISFTNNGSQPIGSINLYYRINDNPEVVEAYTPTESVKSGETGEYTFRTPADLSAELASFVIKAGVRMEGDANPNNNELIAYAENLTAGIPYIPNFIDKEDGSISSDSWETKENNTEAWWEYNYENRLFYWMIKPKKAEADCDAYVISRPVRLEGGKTYSVQFNVYTVGEGTGINKMRVCVATDKELENAMTEIWKNEAVGADNAMNSMARFKAPSDGIYYFAFNCFSTPGAAEMHLDNLAVREVAGKDVGLIDVVSPMNNQYLYSDAETFQILVRNLGLTAISANELKVNMRLNGGEIISETLAKALEPNEQTAYTFAKKLDLSDVNSKRLLSVWTSLPEDQDVSNDTITIDYNSTVTGIPYIPDFGTARQNSGELDYWTAVNGNADYYTFSSSSDSSLDTYVFSYGGGFINWTNVIIPSSDEQLYSRPIRLERGSQYKISFLSKVGKSDASMPLAVNIYKVEGEVRTLVKSVWDGTVTSSVYQEMILKTEIDETGVYEVGFSVVNAEPVDFKIYLGSFRLTKVYARDLSLEEIVMPTANISCYNTFPLGAIVKNEGKEAITAFSLKAVSPSLGEVKRDFSGISLEPDDTYLVYFDKDLTFDGADTETLTLTVTAEGDGDEANNQKALELKYIEPESVPYSPNPFMAVENWAVVNHNKDAYRFVPVKSGTVGFQYIGNKEVEAEDWLVTPCIALEKETTYSFDLRFGVNAGDTAAIDIYAYDAVADKRVDIVRLESIVKSSEYLGYFTVPENGNYNLCFAPSGKVPSLFVAASPSVKKVTEKPDIQLMEITAPKEDAVYSADEKVTVTFMNKGKLPLTGIPFTCKVGDKEYHSFSPKYLLAKDEDVYTMEFSGINLYAPGEYTIQVTAEVTEELTPENNTLTVKVKSLPVPDVAVVSLDTPESGLLSKEEAVTITLKNEGKGALTDIPVQCVVICGDNYAKTLTGTVAGPLADGEAVQYTFEEKINMYEEGTYHFVVTSALTGDVKEENNRLETSVTSSHKAFDAGVTAILTPKDAILSSNETVEITVKNYSEVDLFDVPVSAEITYLNNDAAQIQVLSGTVAVLNSGESVNYAFTETVTMKSPGDYRIRAYTSVKNDVNTENDTCKVVVKCLKQDVGVVEIVSPESGEELGIQEVTIKIKNFGEAAVGNIPVSYKIGAMPQLGTVEETIQPGETLVYTFPAPYEFVGYKKYTIIAATALEEDVDPTNDTCTKEIENEQGNGINAVTSVKASVYPNPSAGEVTVTTAASEIQTILVCNMQGMVLHRYEGINTFVYQMDLNLSEGNYIIRVTTAEGTSNYKLMLKK